MYGDPGYQRSGLYAEYERLHPNVRIVQTGRAPQAGYWQALQGALKSGRGLADIQAVPVADIAAVTSSLAGDFVPLNTLGGVSGGTSAFADDWLPWVARQAANRADHLRARRGDRPDRDVLPDQPARQGRLPTRPAVLARDWSTWSGYLRSGRLFRSRIPHGPAFTDSAASLYGVMAAQAPEHTTARRDAWPCGESGHQGGLGYRGAGQPRRADCGTGPADHGVGPGGGPQRVRDRDVPGVDAAPDRGPGRPARLGRLERDRRSGRGGQLRRLLPGAAEGGPPSAGRVQLASFLTGEQAGVRLFRADGDFPANFAAATAVTSVTSGYFSEARVGRIFSQAADRTPDAPAGPASGAIAAIVNGQLARVESGRRSAGSAWRAVLRQASAAGTASAAGPASTAGSAADTASAAG